ncbi:MAG: hypothetical protein J5695_07200 [Bacteroidales bacterium]|nr:hypothetical protein [Bacteroidales bacterium]
MKTLFLILAILSAAPGFESAVLRLTGASVMEDLDESVIERYRALALRPLNLNSAGRSRLLSSGLLTPFQAASLLDYRQRTGDVLSFAELALVDGFPADFVEALRQFVTLDSTAPPGQRPRNRLGADIMVRGSAREQDGWAYTYGSKVKLSYGDRAELNWGSRTTYSDQEFRLGTVSAAYYGRGVLGKVVLGHFGARFGQGLTQWSGFSMQPYGSVASLRRSGTGFAATSSFSPELCGLAADFDLGRWNIGAGYSVTGRLPVANVSYIGRTFTAGITATDKAVGVNWQVGIPNASIYGEAAWNNGPQAVAGLMWVPFYGSKVGAVARYISGTPEFIAGASLKAFDSVVAVSTRQFRATAKYAPEFTAGPFTITPSLRLAARHTDAWRLEGRGEAGLALGGWVLRSRLDIVHATALAWLVNAEAGHTAGPLKAYLRWTLFKVENWPDRIYVYERDAPGSFNVPAYYGKGYALSLVSSYKPSRKHGFYCRISYISYPWMTEFKPSKFEVKLQYQLSLLQ